KQVVLTRWPEIISLTIDLANTLNKDLDFYKSIEHTGLNLERITVCSQEAFLKNKSILRICQVKV
ncbi:MAG: hypothetical protein KAI29_19870, partial [Cyclobacteriaceae bacterium]|nr:hypothetical protein [Cyclobacteriaceae bacterium]